MSDLPTKPGPYYWREKDGGQWVIRIVDADDDGELHVLLDDVDIWLPIPIKPTEQWLPIPTADELVELQAKAKAYDEGQEMMQLAYDANKMSLLVTPDNKEVVDIYTKATGYTCEPVTIVRKAKR